MGGCFLTTIYNELCCLEVVESISRQPKRSERETAAAFEKPSRLILTDDNSQIARFARVQVSKRVRVRSDYSRSTKPFLWSRKTLSLQFPCLLSKYFRQVLTHQVCKPNSLFFFSQVFASIATLTSDYLNKMAIQLLFYLTK